MTYLIEVGFVAFNLSAYTFIFDAESVVSAQNLFGLGSFQ